MLISGNLRSYETLNFRTCPLHIASDYLTVVILGWRTSLIFLWSLMSPRIASCVKSLEEDDLELPNQMNKQLVTQFLPHTQIIIHDLSFLSLKTNTALTNLTVLQKFVVYF